MAKIVLSTIRARNARTGRVEEIVTHGVNVRSGRPEAFEGETPQDLGAAFCPEIGEWVLDRDRPAMRVLPRAA